jgi:uncharacterized protein (TIGR04255 family)
VTPVRDTSTLNADLPAFDKPPVVEVAASLQFAPIDGLDAARLGLLWGRYRDRYPRTEIHPALNAVVESFGLPVPQSVSFAFVAEAPPLRFWFLTERGTRLVQVQQDRFALNWRSLESDEEEYPHYPELSQLLVEEFKIFETFLRDEGLQAPELNQVELTYVNHMGAGSPKSQREPLEKMVLFWAGNPSQSSLPDPDEVSFAASHVMHGADGPLGRLHIQLESRYRAADKAPIYFLQLVARGAPSGAGIAGALTAMDRGHRWIVQNFAAITTPEMHRIWERTR